MVGVTESTATETKCISAQQGHIRAIAHTDIAIPGDGQSRHDVDVADGDLPDEVAVLGEDLHINQSFSNYSG